MTSTMPGWARHLTGDAAVPSSSDTPLLPGPTPRQKQPPSKYPHSSRYGDVASIVKQASSRSMMSPVARGSTPRGRATSPRTRAKPVPSTSGTTAGPSGPTHASARSAHKKGSRVSSSHGIKAWGTPRGPAKHWGDHEAASGSASSPGGGSAISPGGGSTSGGHGGLGALEGVPRSPGDYGGDGNGGAPSPPGHPGHPGASGGPGGGRGTRNGESLPTVPSVKRHVASTVGRRRSPRAADETYVPSPPSRSSTASRRPNTSSLQYVRGAASKTTKDSATSAGSSGTSHSSPAMSPSRPIRTPDRKGSPIVSPRSGRVRVAKLAYDADTPTITPVKPGEDLRHPPRSLRLSIPTASRCSPSPPPVEPNSTATTPRSHAQHSPPPQTARSRRSTTTAHKVSSASAAPVSSVTDLESAKLEIKRLTRLLQTARRQSPIKPEDTPSSSTDLAAHAIEVLDLRTQIQDLTNDKAKLRSKCKALLYQIRSHALTSQSKRRASIEKTSSSHYNLDRTHKLQLQELTARRDNLSKLGTALNMATKVEDILKPTLTCVQCTELMRQPIILYPCGHMYCKSCLYNYQQALKEKKIREDRRGKLGPKIVHIGEWKTAHKTGRYYEDPYENGKDKFGNDVYVCIECFDPDPRPGMSVVTVGALTSRVNWWRQPVRTLKKLQDEVKEQVVKLQEETSRLEDALHKSVTAKEGAVTREAAAKERVEAIDRLEKEVKGGICDDIADSSPQNIDLAILEAMSVLR